ncbi:GSU2403 family nucleotidyltransferase fold protein [Chlamydiota bacterium]
MNFDEIKICFFNVLDDIQDYLPDLTLVGGWMPFIYTDFLWKNGIKNPGTTVDIDFGIDQSITRNYSRTIFQTLSSLNYKERHLRMDRMLPVVMHKEKIPVEFITYPKVDMSIIKKIVGEQIYINKIDKFDFLLKNRISVTIQSNKKKTPYHVNCPRPSAFLFHKSATFTDRENEEKQAKDLFYMYFILRYAPDIENILKEVSLYQKEGVFKQVPENLNSYFERSSSKGCLLVEKENGPDEFIEDVRQDIFERFKNLRERVIQ